ncbi:MAG TPA: LON peptidase substrate-binding domain-containing protein [Vicinamibacterales bacterium]|nr:LON peptidase substrate-binding domain-containing protein [Vicinamibacterales bacterium]
MLPATIPIFPLPNAVLFPNVFMPLHIFEARYRAMVSDALAGDRIIGMVLLKAGFERDYEGRPPIFPVGCAGVITHSEPLPDGRFNIVLKGLEKFRITAEDSTRTYRLATIDALPEQMTDAERAELRRLRQRVEALLAAAVEREGGDPKFPPAVADEDLVNALAQYTGLEPIERQALLERSSVLERCQGLIELIEMKTIGRGATWKGRAVH